MSKHRRVCFSSFTYSYLSRAKILAQTVRRFHPEWEIWAVIVDRKPIDFPEHHFSAFDQIIHADELPIANFRSWLFKHDIVEACTAVKGAMMSHILEQGADQVIYFDPDIALLSAVDNVTDALENYSIILTPHQVEANTSDIAIRDNEMSSLLYGVYNLGFVAVRGDSVGKDFAQWWSAQLYRACYDSVQTGIFTDQKYCDLAPALFENVWIERSAGCNVASWNLSTRRIKFQRDGSCTVNNDPLRFYHFTKIGASGDDMTNRYAGSNVEVFEIWNWYKRFLSTTSVPEVPRGYWHYGHFSNGLSINKQVREFYRSRPDLMSFFDDPFIVDGNSLFEWLKREQPGLLDSTSIGGFLPI